MNIHIRNLDDSTVRALKQRAARNGRSAEAEYRAILTAAAAQDAGHDWRSVADRIRAHTVGRPQTPAEILVREGRQER
jgi:plasmid stability protein